MYSTQPPRGSASPTPTLGPYTLVDRIATGGMAEVFRAHEPRAAGEPRTVVIKRMLPHVAAQPGSRALFEQEARLGSLVRHPNVVDVLDLGSADGQPFLVLEYVPGVDLWQLMRSLARSGRKLEVPQAIRIVCDLLAGLEAVHRAVDDEGSTLEIVHRDVSPSNVLLSIHGGVKLGDFGIARRIEEQSYQHGLGGRRGKLGYLAPEQVRGTVVDRRADVFSSAVIATELLMGRPLFTGGSELAILLAIRDAQIHPFLEVLPTLPQGLGEALLAALARDASERVSSAAELREELLAFSAPDRALELERELGALVRRAAGPSDAAPEHTPHQADIATPARPETAAAAWDALDGGRTPITADVPALEYHVRTGDGSLLGPYSYARIIEAIATGRVGPTDQVQQGEGPFHPVRGVDELARHLPASTGTTDGHEDTLSQAPATEYDLAEGHIITALAGAALRRETGLWLCEQDGIRKEVYVSQGAPEFVTSNQAGELLGEWLVSREVISREELDMALAVMPRFEGRLGDTLVGLGLVEPVPLFQHIATQVRDKLLDLFTWPRGTAQFFDGVAPPSSGFPLGLDPWKILDEGIGQRLAGGLEDPRFRSRLTTALARTPAWLDEHALPEAGRRVWQLVETPSPIAEVAEALARPDDPNRGYRAVILLLHLGAIRWVDG